LGGCDSLFKATGAKSSAKAKTGTITKKPQSAAARMGDMVEPHQGSHQ